MIASMQLPNPAAGARAVALFDLDGTLTWRDSLLPFLCGYLVRHPARLLRLWRLPFAACAYLAGARDRGILKSRLIRMVMGGDSRAAIDAWAEAYVGALLRRGAFRPAALEVLEAHRSAGDHLVLLSASPDLYVARIGRSLGFELTMCTELRWQGATLDGRLNTPNRRGAEKLRCLEQLRADYAGMPIAAYGNSASDLPHLKRADRAVLVNAGGAARRLAAAAGIAVADWT
jgi:phosphatidylglycerophosphatase C